VAISQYGAQSIFVHVEDNVATHLRTLIQRIVERGDVLPLPLPVSAVVLH
jgi:hypothetical protein